MDPWSQFLVDLGIPFIEAGALGLGAIGSLTWYWHQQQRRSDHMRETFDLPSTMTHEQILNFTRSLSGFPTPGMLSPAQTVTIDRYIDSRGERFFLTTPHSNVANLDELAYQHLEVTLEPVEREDDPIRTTTWTSAAELSLRGRRTPSAHRYAGRSVGDI
jgi:hypothetical protein